MLFKFTNGKTVDLNNELGACKMVIREFDNYFFDFVRQKGADFIHSRVENITEVPEGVIVQTTEGDKESVSFLSEQMELIAQLGD